MDQHFIFQKLLEMGAQIDVEDKKGWTPLHCAASAGHTVKVTDLLMKGADVEAVNKNGQRPADLAKNEETENLLLAWPNNQKLINEQKKFIADSIFGYIQDIVFLLGRGVNINCKHDNGMTALHWAIFKGHKDIITLLLEKGADFNAKDNSGWTALHFAAHNGYTDIVKELLINGANVAAVNVYGNKASALARNKDTKNLLLTWSKKQKLFIRTVKEGKAIEVKNLLDKGVSINSEDKRGRTALHWAVCKGFFKIIDMLLENGANIEAPDNVGRTALHLAANEANVYIVLLLMNNGANIEASDKDGQTALHLATIEGHEQNVNQLLDRGANTEVSDKYGRTALHWSASEGHADIVEKLLKKGANIEASDEDGHTALHFGTIEGHEPIVKLLLEKRLNIDAADKDGKTALYWGAAEDHLGIVKLLLNNWANIEARDKNGETALHRAKNKVKKLLQIQSRNLHFLHAATEGNVGKIKEFLMMKGVDINFIDMDGQSTLHLSSKHGHTAAVSMLLDLGATLDARDKHQCTALHYASKNDHLDIIEILMMRGANIEAVSIDNKRAIDLANNKETKILLLTKFKVPPTKKILTFAAEVLFTFGVLYVFDSVAIWNQAYQLLNDARQLDPVAIWNQAYQLLNGARPLGIIF
jgi:ankyrin repeat protein